MGLPEENYYTVEDIFALPETVRAELIDGKIYYQAAPTTRHQRISRKLSTRIDNYIGEKGGSCEIFSAPFAVFLNEEDETHYLEPDIVVVCDPSKLTEKGCSGAPDWVIEIVSPGSQRMDYMVKLFKYRACGVREYWIVDPDKNLVLVYNFETDEVFNYTCSQTVKANIYDDLYIDMGAVSCT